MIRFKPTLSLLVMMLAIGFCQSAASGGTLNGADAKPAVKVTQITLAIKGMT